MFGSYFKIAIRNIMKTKLYSFLNIMGLSIGLASVILIILYTYHQLSYDHYHQKADRIYRIASHFTIDGKDDLFAASSFAIAPLFKEIYPEVEEFVRFTNAGELVLTYKDKQHKVERNFFANQSALSIFTHEFSAGNPANALDGVNKVVLSETTAQQIFGEEPAVGKNITTSSGALYKVTGVFKDLPDNVHLKYDALYSADTMYQRIISQAGPEALDYHNPQLLWQINDLSYIVLKENANHQEFLKKAKGFGDKYMNDQGKAFNASFQPIIQNLKETHFCQLQWDMPQGKKEYLMLFVIVGFFIMSIASINYMNLATARSAKRAKEVGLRKVIGAQKNQLISQFLIESVVMTLIALFFALILAELVLPTFNHLAGTKLSIGLHTPIFIYLGIFIVSILVGIISGSYPAFVLSSYQPAIVIKGEVTKGVRGKLVREILVILQFSLSIIMIIGTLVVLKQLNYLRNQELGFNKENVLCVVASRDSLFAQNYQAFRNEVLQNPNIKNVATTNIIPAGEMGKLIFTTSNKGKNVSTGFNYLVADPSFLSLLGAPMVQGKGFDTIDGINYTGPTLDGQATEFILNESAAKAIGWEKNAVNQNISPSGNPSLGKVIGVVKNFNYNSLHNSIEPLVIMPATRVERNVMIRINGEDTPQTLALVEIAWMKHFPKSPFEFRFLEDKIDELYESEVKLSQIFTYFSILCIFIACLGLLGLATFAAQQRTKEIGIRKVMGSSIRSIILLLTKDFSKLVIISNIIALPVSYYLLYQWLNKFPYHISIPVSSFVIAMFSAFLIAWITVGIVAYRAASSNPVEALRYE